MSTNFWKSTPLWLVKIATFITPFIPLYIAQNMFFPFISGKAFAFRFLSEIIFFSWVFLAIFWKEFRPKPTMLLWTITVFMAIVTLATFLGANPFRSFWSNFERMEGLVTYIHLFAFFLGVAHVFKKSDWTIFFNVFIFSGIIQNIYALFQRSGFIQSMQGGFRVDGTLGNPTYVAAYLFFVICFAGILLLYSSKALMKWYYSFAIVFSLVVMYFTATRGAFIALALSFVLGSILYFVMIKPKSEKEKLVKKVLIAVLLLFIVSGSGLFLAKDSGFVKNSPVLSRLASISISSGSSRFQIWRMAFNGFKERPILGWGPSNFEILFGKYYSPQMYAQEPWFDRSHNIVLDWLVNAGILGLLSYLSIFAAAIYMLFKNSAGISLTKNNDKNPTSTDREKKLLIVLACFFLAYFVQNLFVFDQLATYIGFFSILAFIQSYNPGNQKIVEAGQANLKSQDDIVFYGSVFGIVGFLLFLATAYFVNFQGVAANKDLLLALSIQGQYPKEAYVLYKKALAEKSFANVEVREQLAEFARHAATSQALTDQEKIELVNNAMTELAKNIQENPLNPRGHHFLGVLYMQFGLYDAAIDILKKAQALSPKKQIILFSLAEAYTRKGDYDSALQVVKTAFNEEKNFDQARINLAAVYILKNNQAEADKLLIERYGTVDVADATLAQFYSNLKKYDRLLGVTLAYMKSNPSNPDYVINAANAYAKAGRKYEGIKLLQDNIGKYPDKNSEFTRAIEDIKKF